MEVSDRNRCVEDADAVVVPGLFSFSEGSVCRTCWGREDGSNIFTSAVLCRDASGAVREGCVDRPSGGGEAMRALLWKGS
jgi:hypothetical protein